MTHCTDQIILSMLSYEWEKKYGAVWKHNPVQKVAQNTHHKVNQGCTEWFAALTQRNLPRCNWTSFTSRVLDLRCRASWQAAVTTLSMKSSAICSSICQKQEKEVRYIQGWVSAADITGMGRHLNTLHWYQDVPQWFPPQSILLRCSCADDLTTWSAQDEQSSPWRMDSIVYQRVVWFLSTVLWI